MAQMNPVVIENGSTKVRYDFAFRSNASSNPDAVLDCGSNAVASVVRTSAGLYTVTLAAGCRLKEITCAQVTVAPTAATGDLRVGYVVPGSLSVSARTFTVQVVRLADTTADDALEAQDPEDNSIVNVTVVGPMSATFADE